MNEHIFKKPLICWIAHESNVSGANIALLEYVSVLKELYEDKFKEYEQENFINLPF